MNKKINLDIYLRIELLLCLIILSSTLFEQSSLSSAAFLATFVVVFGVWVASLYSNRELLKSSTLPIIIIVCAAAFVLLDLLLMGALAVFNFEYIKKLLIFCTTIIFIDTLTKQYVGERTMKIVKNTVLLAAIIILFSYFVLGIQTTQGIKNKILTMNFSSANLLGMWLTCVAMYIGFYAYKGKNKIERIFFLCIFILLCSLILKTDSRNAIIALAIFSAALIYFGVLKRGKGKKIKKWLIIGILLFPLLFVFVYMTMMNTLVEIFEFMAGEGKAIESRFGTWEYALDHISLIANYYTCSNGTGAFQMHNTHLDLLCSYGVFVFAFVMKYVYDVVSNINRRLKNSYQILALICFLCVWFMGTFEAALFSGGQGIYIFGCVFLLLANYEKSEDNRVERKRG